MTWILASEKLPADRSRVWVRFGSSVELALYRESDRRFYSDNTWIDDDAPRLMWAKDPMLTVENIQSRPFYESN